MTRFFLIRHGETDWNAEGRVQGGGLLNARGRRQAQALAQRLKEMTISAIYASPAERTGETADTLGQALEREVQTREDLRDLDFGRWQATTVEVARSQDADLVRRWMEAPHTVRFPGGESLADLRARVMSVIQKLQEQHPEQGVLVVTHDSPIRTIICAVLDLDDSHHQQVRADLGSLTIVDIRQGNSTVVAVNDTCHLGGADASP